MAVFSTSQGIIDNATNRSKLSLSHLASKKRVGIPSSLISLKIGSDVAVFTSNPFLKALRLEGIPTLFLETKCDRESFDLFVALSIIPSEVENTATQLSTGVLRIANCDKGIKGVRKIRLQPILATFKEGDRLRISISGSAWPAIGINPGQSQYLCEGPSPHCLVTTISLLLSNSKLKFESLISS